MAGIDCRRCARAHRPGRPTSVPRYDYWAMAAKSYGDRHYPKIVQRMHQLHGTVISPDDPTIAFLAKGYLGRSLVSQLDALGWKSRPTYLAGEMKHADYLVQVNGAWTTQVTPHDLLLPDIGRSTITSSKRPSTRFGVDPRPNNLSIPSP